MISNQKGCVIKLLRMVNKNDGNYCYTKSFLSFAFRL